MKKDELNNYLINEEATIVDAMQAIDRGAKGIVFVVDENLILKGALTDGDIRRWLIKTGDINGNIKKLFNKSPHTIYRDEACKAHELMTKHSVTALPVITRKGKIYDVIFREDIDAGVVKEDNVSLKGVPTIIMAGGKGTRLYPYTKILPKPLIPIGDVPIMERIIDRFTAFGVRKFYATVNYKKGMIRSYFNDISTTYKIKYVEETEPLGTAGSIRLIKDEFSKPVIVTNCDILINADYGEIYKYHQESGNAMTIVSALKNIVVPYGVINSGENGEVLSMDEKPRLSYFVNTGMYVLNPDIIKFIPENKFYHMTHLSEYLLSKRMKVGMYPISEDSFLDMGEFEEMSRMEEKLNLKV
ncbi:MAG: CBS domain-containing protein [Lachnospiraceae bacterium]|nr:CBS domain-containing protein [Lachnospiraceae bacterium]